MASEETLIDRLCPMIPDDTLIGLPYVAWPYKRQLVHLHRCVMVYLQLLILTTFMIIPVWSLNMFQSDYYVAPIYDMCLAHNGTLMTEFVDADRSCPYLTKQALENGWRLSPVQQHAHRYGFWYHFLIHLHVGFGSLLVCCSFISIIFTSVCGPLCRSCDIANVRKFGAFVHYLFMWIWVFNITTSIILAYVRLATLGTNPDNWRWMFNMGFFFLFYFVVLIVLLGLETMFDTTYDIKFDEWNFTVLEEYLGNLTSYTAQGMFFLLIPTVIGAHCSQNIRDILGFSDYDVSIVTVVNLFIIEPFLGRALTIWTGRQTYYRCISSCTLYFITLLVYSINLTYKYNETLTVPVLIFWFIIYLAYLIRSVGIVTRVTHGCIKNHAHASESELLLEETLMNAVGYDDVEASRKKRDDNNEHDDAEESPTKDT